MPCVVTTNKANTAVSSSPSPSYGCLDCVLAPSKAAVPQMVEALSDGVDDAVGEFMLKGASGHNCHNTSRYSFATLLDDPDNFAANLNLLIALAAADLNLMMRLS